MFKINLSFGKVSKLEIALRLSLYAVLTIIASTFIIFIFFLYNKFYLTLTQAEEIIILKSQLAVDSLNMDLFYKAQIFEEQKNARITPNWNELKNPFSP